MRQINFALALLTAAALAACGGTSSKGGDQTLKTKYSAMVTFGDSLADVGTYAVGVVAAAGGGKYTINGDNTAINPTLTGKNWTELLAAQLGLPAPCAAQTGLVGSVTVTNHAGCYGYAQGGARVTNPVGPGNVLTGDKLGQMTVPVVTQIANHLAAVGGKFTGTELVTITVGGNDVSMQLAGLSIAATAAGQAAGAAEGAKVGAQTFATTLVGLLAAGAPNPASAAQAIGLAMATESARPGSTQTTVVGAAVTAAAMAGNVAVADPAVYGPIVAKAQADATVAGNAAGAAAGAKAGAAYAAAHGPDLVVAMGTAGAELAAMVKTQIVAKGANFVIVNNLGDFANAPVGKAQDASTQGLIALMVSAFNDQLKAGLAGEPKVLLNDLYTLSHDEIINPAPYGLTNTTSAACTTNAFGGSALGCTGKTLNSGDVSHYMFADDRHPTPYEYRLIAQFMAEKMATIGWL
ncbi:MAG: esterase [Pseudomonadota bacterium]